MSTTLMGVARYDADHPEADWGEVAISPACVSYKPCTDQRANLGRPCDADRLDVCERNRHMEADMNTALETTAVTSVQEVGK